MGKRRQKWREYYILDAKGRPVLVDLLTWAKWFGTAKRIVRQSHVGPAWVSTIFLGIDHSFTDEGPPVLWESAAFRGKRKVKLQGKKWEVPQQIAMERCAGSREQAEAMHAAMVRRVRKSERQRAKRIGPKSYRQL